MQGTRGSTGAESLPSHSLDPHAVVTPGSTSRVSTELPFVTVSGKRPATWLEQKNGYIDHLPNLIARLSYSLQQAEDHSRWHSQPDNSPSTSTAVLPHQPLFTRRGFSIRQPPHLVCNNAFLLRRARSSVSRTSTHKATSTTSSINGWLPLRTTRSHSNVDPPYGYPTRPTSETFTTACVTITS